MGILEMGTPESGTSERDRFPTLADLCCLLDIERWSVRKRLLFGLGWLILAVGWVAFGGS